MNSKTIAILTDFGTEDPYVGIMKGIISDLSPGSQIIDVTNHIPPGDVQRGAFVLWQAVQDFPNGTIFLCVVDPGVGTERKAVYLETRNQIFIGPDNGLFSYLLFNSTFSCWELSNPDYQKNNSSATFHGRDIFAPAAAFAARSVSGDQFGPGVEKLNELPKPILKIEERSITGEIISNDHYGNLITSVGLIKYQNDLLSYQSWIDGTERIINNTPKIRIQIKDHQLPLVRTFASIETGLCSGLVGSTGLLEIVANQSSAKAILGLDKGDPVTLSWD